jgi:hypothetical protein
VPRIWVMSRMLPLRIALELDDEWYRVSHLMCSTGLPDRKRSTPHPASPREGTCMNIGRTKTPDTDSGSVRRCLYRRKRCLDMTLKFIPLMDQKAIVLYLHMRGCRSMPSTRIWCACSGERSGLLHGDEICSHRKVSAQERWTSFTADDCRTRSC